VRAIGLIGLVAFATGPAIACSLNPQPLPPFDPDDSSDLSPGNGEVADAGASSEEAGRTAHSDGGPKENHDASVDASDASAPTDASDGEANERVEAGLRDASDEGTSDAASPPDATAD
jgi:hypothetical protein